MVSSERIKSKPAYGNVNLQTQTGVVLSQKRLLYLSGAPRVSTHPMALSYGPRNHVLGIIEGFKENGWAVDQFILGDAFDGFFSRKQLEEVTGNKPSGQLAVDMARMASNIFSSLAVRLKHRDQYDLVYERYGLFQGIGRVIQRKGVPWVVETNEVYFQEAAADRNALFLQQRANRQESGVYHQCDQVVTITPSLKELLAHTLKIDRKKILVIPNGIRKGELTQKTAKIKNEATFNIVFVGLLTEWIGIQFLIKAVAESRLPIKVTILGDGPYRKTLETLSRDKGVTSQFNFKGFIPRPELFEYLDQADLGYSGHIPLSTNRFHSPMKLYEYLARGLPVISCDDEDSHILNGENNLGFVFKRGDAGSLLKTLIRAYESRPQWQQMGSRARDLIAQKHLWQHRVKDILMQSNIPH